MNRFSWGFGPFEETLREYEARGLIGGRVLRDGGRRYTLMTAQDEFTAVAAGKLKVPVVVGDIVALEPTRGRIEAVLTRGGVIERRRPGGGPPQLLAANVDVAFCATAAGSDFSARRVERFIALAAAGRVRPVVVLTKSDQAAGDEEAQLNAAAAGHTVVVTSAHSSIGMQALREQLGEGRTGVLLGSSGVGKSTLVNALAGGVEQATANVRAADGKGRHTTTSRALIQLPNGGGMLIDTPGLREVGLVAGKEHVEAAFPEVAELLRQCRYSDCVHKNEPGCAIREALASGQLNVGRWQRFLQLQEEAASEAIRQNQHAIRQHDKARARHYRQTMRRHRRRKGD